MVDRPIGAIDGVPVGSTFASRKQLAAAGIHTPPVAGFWGGRDGSVSIVLNGGYEDDADLGNEILYIGAGGNDPNTGRQTDHQAFDKGNLGLVVARDRNAPGRVTRGSGVHSPFAPNAGYRYDGLSLVEDASMTTGKSGFRVCQYRLVAIPGESTEFATLARGDGGDLLPSAPLPVAPTGSKKPGVYRGRVGRTIRDTDVANYVKEIHRFKCQVCNTTIETATGPYAEAAHVRPLGKPHLGPDVVENIICLCPNHHTAFDKGGFTIEDDGRLVGLSGRLRFMPGHTIDPIHLSYHRSMYARTNSLSLRQFS